MRAGAWGVAALVLLAALVAHSLDVAMFLTGPAFEGEQPRRYEIPPGASLAAVARDLHARGLLDRPFYWRLAARAKGVTGRIRVGEYELPPGITPLGMLDLFVSGKTVQYSLTLVEGWTFAQVMEAVRAHPQLVQTLPAQDAGAELMRRLGREGEHPEGWFFPDTYYFPKGTTDVAFLRRAHQTMVRRLEQEWAARSPGLPLASAYEALILASIVEKETGVAEERPMIAAVFINRLKRGMRLQTDPTVIYGMGDRYDGNIRKADLLRDTPYNTYTRRGLPPTPIAMPGAGALRATLHPADSPALYFVATGEGGRHHFSETYEAHREAVIKYQLGGKASRYKGAR